MIIQKKVKSLPIKDPYKKVAIIVSIIFGIYAISLVIPLIWATLMSLKSSREYVQNNYGLPQIWLFSNYLKAFKQLSVGDKSMLLMIINSAWYSLGNTFISVSVVTVTAYACARYKFFLGKLCYILVIITMIIPIVSNLGAQFRLARILNTYDSPISLIASAGGINFNMLILFAFFKGIDKSYSEAAYIDGASHMQIFLRVMLPLALAPIFAISMQSFMGLWNDAEGPLIFLPSYPTLSTGLYIYQIEAARTLDYPVLFAGLLMSSIPSITAYVLLHKNIMSLQIGGAIKG